jgi:hypothetical protein
LEGALTALIRLNSWFYVPPSPTQTVSFFSGRKGWFSEREEIILVTRVIKDDLSKADMHKRHTITLRKFGRTVTDYDMWPLYIIGVTWAIPFTPPLANLTLTLKSLGFNTFETNLLTIPSNFPFRAGSRYLFPHPTNNSFYSGPGYPKNQPTAISGSPPSPKSEASPS